MPRGHIRQRLRRVRRIQRIGQQHRILNRATKPDALPA